MLGGVFLKTVPVTKARQSIYKLIDESIKHSEPIQITTKNGNAILIGEDDWRAIQETMHLLSIPGMRESILEGGKEKVEECTKLEELDW